MNSGRKRREILFVAAMVLFSRVCLAKYSGGSGTSGAPYKIGTVTDLLTLGGNTGDYDANFVLTADINLAGHTFTTAVIAPDSNSSDIFFNGTEFTGIFDGAGHTISNLTINTGGSGNDFLGLFGFVGAGGKIENLQLENFGITGGNGSMFIGGLAGENAGTISNCFSESNVTGGNNSLYIGGLVGVEVNDGNIIDSYSAGTVSGGNDANYIGGLAGGIYVNGNISMCFSTSDVTGENNGSYIGGLVGENYLGSIVNCFSTGTVTNEANCFSLGGLVGRNFWGSIENCYSTDTVFVGVNKADIGGLVGTNLTYAGGTFVSSSYFLDIAGPNNDIGTLLTDIQMKQQNSFAGWDFNSVWQISEGVDYPKLAWQSICTPLSAPTNVSATNGTYDDHIRITWNSVSGAAGYEVWRNTSNSSGSASKLGDYTSPFDDSNVTSGTYYYWVKAKNSCGTSGFSSSDSGYISLPCTVPSAPTGVSATDGTYNDHIRITWNSASGATSYEVWRNDSNSSGSALKLGDINASPFDDSGVTTGKTYYYWVKAKNICGTSGFSSSDSGYATQSCTVPSAPTGVSATDGTYSDHIRVTWNSASGATAYEVWRNDSNSSGSALKLGDYTSPFDDYGVTTGTTYYYWVKAKNSCGTSDFSLSDSGYVSTNPSTVSIIKCTVTAGSKVNSDKISFSGKMGATANDFNGANKSSNANFVKVTIRAESAEDMAPCVFIFPVNNKTFKKGKFSSTITSKPSKMSFAFDTKKTAFSFSASNVDLTGLSCPVGIEIDVGGWTGTAEVNEAIVNGPKKPIPINLLMGVKDSLRVDGKPKFTKKSGVTAITQVSVSGGFSVGNLSDANMATHLFYVTVGSQTFTVPIGKFKYTKGKFTCSKVTLSGGEIATATFDFNKCTFTLTIKNTSFTTDAGETVFGIDFASYSGRDVVTLPP